MPRSTILHINLVAPKPVAESHTDGHSWLLNAFTVSRDRVVLAFGGEGTSKHENLGRLYSGLKPRADGTFRVELGAVLADRLPAVGEHEDYVLTVRLDEGDEPRLLCFSNQMMRVRYSHSSGLFHLSDPGSPKIVSEIRAFRRRSSNPPSLKAP